MESIKVKVNGKEISYPIQLMVGIVVLMLVSVVFIFIAAILSIMIGVVFFWVVIIIGFVMVMLIVGLITEFVNIIRKQIKR